MTRQRIDQIHLKQELSAKLPVVIEADYHYLSRENKRLKGELSNITEVSSQLVAVIKQINNLLEDDIEKPDIRERLREQAELGILFGEVLAIESSVDEAIGRYLLGAREEAKSIVRQALAVAEIVSQPTITLSHHKKETYSRKAVSEMVSQFQQPEKRRPSSYRSRLATVETTYLNQCESLRGTLEGRASLMANEKEADHARIGQRSNRRIKTNHVRTDGDF